jgi:hypothetical protein
MAPRRTAEEVARLLKSFEQSKLSRQEFCEREKIPVTTLDYYRQRAARKAKARLVKVKITPEAVQPEGSFTLVLGNGRRIESSWRFGEAELARLIRVAESM